MSFIVAVFAARDSARNHAILRTLGATPRQTVVVVLVGPSSAPARSPWSSGSPSGSACWSLMEGGDLPEVSVSAMSLVLLAAAVPVVFAAIVSVPARLLARQPVAPLLAYE